MTILFEENFRKESLLAVARKMVTAARTAPKGRGNDNLILSIATEETIELIATKMKAVAQSRQGLDFFIRDANNILLCDVIVLIGTRIKPLGLPHCGLCGFKNCEEKNQYPHHPCAFNTGDLGIAIGSAVSMASNEKVDNRVMFSVGMTVRELGLLGNDAAIIYGIPLSCSGKSPFFDRK